MYFRFWWPQYHFRLSDIVAITWRHFIRARHRRKSRTCHWNFDAVCFSSSGITTSVLDFPVHFLRARHGRKPQVCRRKCSDICHTVGDISTSGLDGHIAISGCPSMSHLSVDTLFEFGVVEEFVCRAGITAIPLSLGAQSTLGGQDIFARKYMHEKLTKYPNFT